MSPHLDDILGDLNQLHNRVDRRFERTLAAVGASHGCGSGCSSCCVDDLTIWQIEGTAIARWLQAQAARRAPPLSLGATGGCAFLAKDRCQIYPVRPYVCRSQGAVLRWFEGPKEDEQLEEDDGSIVERRDTCPEHLQQVDLAALPEPALFQIGPAEAELVDLATRELAADNGRGLPGRVALRDLAMNYGAR